MNLFITFFIFSPRRGAAGFVFGVIKRFLRAHYRRQEDEASLFSLEGFLMEIIKEIIAEITHEVLAIDELLGFEGD